MSVAAYRQIGRTIAVWTLPYPSRSESTMAGRNMRLKAMAKTVAAMESRFARNASEYGRDFDGWRGVSMGGYKYVWISPCGSFVAKMTRPDQPYMHGAAAEADLYARLPVSVRVYFAVTLRAGETMCVQPRGESGPGWHTNHSIVERRAWGEEAETLKMAIGKTGYFNYDLGVKNIARYGKRYKMIDFAGTTGPGGEDA